MTSAEFELDCAIYDEVNERRTPSSDNIKIEENVCYTNPKLVHKDKYAPTSSSQKGVVALAIVTVVLSLGLIAACIAFALQIAALRSEINSQNGDTVLYSLDNMSDSVIKNEVLFNEMALLQQNLSIVSEWLENVTEQVQQLALSNNMSYQLLQEETFAYVRASFSIDSCADLPPSSPSGYYWVRASNGSAVRVYCDVTRSCGGVTGGWMRVAHLDMNNSSQQCPSGFSQRTDSNIRSCVRNTVSGCLSIIAPVLKNYTHVCGRVMAYQKGATDAFLNSASGIDFAYVDGVSITHGSPRQHIWTLAAALDEIESDGPQNSCPCIRGNPGTNIPSFVGTDYFCDTGSHDHYQSSMFYGSDPLWDSAGCGPLNTCCNFNTPPWFHRQLPQSTSDDIEIRVCTNLHVSNEDVAIQTIDLYVR